MTPEREYLRDLIIVTGATVAKFSRISTINQHGDEFLFAEPAWRIKALVDDLATLEREVAEAREENESLLCDSHRTTWRILGCLICHGTEMAAEVESARERAEAAERQVAEARSEIERLRHGLDEEGLSLAERCCGSIKDHLAKRAEEAERQRDDYQATLNVVGAERDCARIERDALRAVAVLVPMLLDAVDGIQTTVVVQEGDRFFIRESADAWNVLHAVESNQYDVEEAIEKLDTAWPTWREGAGEP